MCEECESEGHRHFDNTEEFQAVFGFRRAPDEQYFGLTPFRDRRVGFSIKRQYPDSVRYKPPKNQHGEPDKVAAIWISYLHPSEISANANIEAPVGRVPITLRISVVSKYLADHFDYSDADENSPTSQEVEASNRTPEPIALEFIHDFFFDHVTCSFVDHKGRTFASKELLDHVFDLHCRTTHFFWGISLRVKLAARDRAVGLLSLLVDFLLWTLRKLFARTIQDDALVSSYFRGYSPGDFKRLKEDTINLFGYTAGRSVMILFCTLVLVGGLSAYPEGYADGLLGYIAGSYVMVVATIVVALTTLDSLLPWLLIYVVNGVIKARAFMMFKKFSVRH